jgi:hypothetical protein
MLTPGNVSDVKAAPALIERAGRRRYLLGDKATMLTGFAVRCAMPVLSLSFPVGETASAQSAMTMTDYRARHLTENAFCRLKDFRRVATRYDNRATL